MDALAVGYFIYIVTVIAVFTSPMPAIRGLAATARHQSLGTAFAPTPASARKGQRPLQRYPYISTSLYVRVCVCVCFFKLQANGHEYWSVARVAVKSTLEAARG